MIHSILKPIALVAVVFAAAACGGGQTPPDNPTDVNGTGTTEPVKPPPPKCEALSENCKAEADTSAKAKSAGVEFKPAKDWIYAQGETSTVAQVSEDGAVIIIGSYTPDKDAKKDVAAREAALTELVKTISVTPPKAGLKVNWKKPLEGPPETNGLKLATFDVAGVERGKKKGTLLVLVAPIADDKALIGAAFADDNDTPGQEALDKTINSIKPDSSAGGDKKPEGDKKTDGDKK